ncbi:hypothetical protein CMV_023553, partial [Castanea mollissima]
TCLSRGGDFHFPPCHILNVCGFRILFDCPMDLSALPIFSSVPTGFDAECLGTKLLITCTCGMCLLLILLQFSMCFFQLVWQIQVMTTKSVTDKERAMMLDIVWLYACWQLGLISNGQKWKQLR